MSTTDTINSEGTMTCIDTIEYTAYVATYDNPVSLRPGILVRSYNYTTTETEDFLDEESIHMTDFNNTDGDEYLPDFDFCEYILLNYGFETVGDWQRSDGEWAVKVRPV